MLNAGQGMAGVCLGENLFPYTYKLNKNKK
jgi:hypothetical protein